MRPDSLISVHTVDLSARYGVSLTRNFDYCNDKPLCYREVVRQGIEMQRKSASW